MADESFTDDHDLVRVLRRLRSFRLIGAGASEEEWWVLFDLEPDDPASESGVPSTEGWLDLEFLSYMINTGGHCHESGDDWDVLLVPFAPAPHLNEPGRTLRFELRGHSDGVEPDDVVAVLREALDHFYFSRGGLPEEE